jgi:hypothetical protein
VIEKNKKYYLAETYEDCLHTASVVRKDNEKILLQLGFSPLQFRHVKDNSLPVKLKRIIELRKLSATVTKGDTIVFHFPLLANAYKVLLRLLHKKGVHTVAIIIDIDGLRYENKKLLQNEIETLQLFSHVIAHNQSMKKFLCQYINETKISVLELFDYPVTGLSSEKLLSPAVCFAGNFDKAGFISQLHTINGINFYLYGPSFNNRVQKNVFYKGSFAPSELPGKLEGSFGLVWDGPSIETCDGYLKFNNPHKLSLYLAAGLPLIVWSESAFATFVQKKNIGVIVTDLSVLEKAIAGITPEQYATMRQNIKPLQSNISKGYYLSKIFTQSE